MKATIKEVRNRKFLVSVSYEDKDVLKNTVDHIKWNAKDKLWEIPGTMENLMLLNSTFEVDSNQITAYVDSLIHEYDKIKYINKIRNDPNWKCLDSQLSYLYQHQGVAFEAARIFNQYAIFLDTGTGKTVTAIEIIKYYNTRTLVVCPLTIIEDAWMEDIEKFSPELKAVSLWAPTKQKRLKKFALDKQIYIANFEGVKMLEKEIINKQFGLIIVDESSKMKDPKSQITKCLLRLSKEIKHRYILSGSPASNTPLEYWAQMNFIDPNILGDNFYRFRNLYFNSDYMGYTWTISDKNRKKIMEKIKQKAIFYSKDECLDLPDRTYQVRKITMSDPQKAAYKEMKNNLVIELKDATITAANQISKIMKLRQVTSGYVYHDAGIVKIADTKLKELQTVLDEIGDKQVIIWLNFHFEGNTIMEKLEGKACALWGKLKHDDRHAAINDFKNGNYQYLVANPATAAHGLTFTNCSYNIYFSLSYSAELWKQSKERTHRIGTTKNVTYIYLLCKDSIDEKIYESLQQKKKISTECLEWLK